MPKASTSSVLLVVALTSAASSGGENVAGAGTQQVGLLQIEHPIMFVTQVPVPAGFATVGATFTNHIATVSKAARGGDLYIRYPDGTLRNLTAEAGMGMDGFQGEQAIAVRQPCVHWNGDKAVFSMVIGAPARRFQYNDYYWQLYEVTGLGLNDTAVITKVPNQPEDYNNVSPIYASDGRIIFSSDRPRSGERHLYPQLDEYESTPTNTGLWSLDPASGDLVMLNHSPSGVFWPSIDSFGRVLFTKWDHLQRDQQADGDAVGGYNNGTFNYTSEDPDAVSAGHNEEVFPEPRSSWINFINNNPDYDGPLRGYEPHLIGHRIELFQPWQINQDGTEEETLNHIGRHEMASYFEPSFNNDPSLEYFFPGAEGSANRIQNFFQLREDPANPGAYYGIDAPTFGTHACGQLLRVTAPPGANPDTTQFDYVTHRDTANPANNPSVNHTGLYRNPLPLSNGSVLVVHTSETRADGNDGTRENPQSRYDLRIKEVDTGGAYWTAGDALTSGISEFVQYYDPDVLVTYDGELWELDPVEVVARAAPTPTAPTLPQPEQDAFDDAGVALQEVVVWLEQNNLALVVSRDVTTRDDADRQQPFNLAVSGGGTETTGDDGPVYDIGYLQFFQGDQIRGMETKDGRRVIAQPMHDGHALNPPAAGPEGSVQLGSDGSMAALVPARRALSWQLTDDAGDAVVRERYWLSFQPGEVRSCTSCHGLNGNDQAGHTVPQNKPQALEDLLVYLRDNGHFDGNEFAVSAVRSCLIHAEGEAHQAEMCMDLSGGGVEARFGGIQAVTVDTSGDVDPQTVSIDNVQLACAGNAVCIASVVLEAPHTLRIEFSSSIENDCCALSFAGVQSTDGAGLTDTVPLRALAGDMDSSGSVSGGDPALIRPHFGETLQGGDLSDARWDFDQNGLVTGADFLLIKPLLGHVLPQCPD